MVDDAKRDEAGLSVAKAIEVIWLALRSGGLEVTGIDEEQRPACAYSSATMA